MHTRYNTEEPLIIASPIMHHELYIAINFLVPKVWVLYPNPYLLLPSEREIISFKHLSASLFH